MSEVRVFEFPGTIAMFGSNRQQAAALLEEVQIRLADEFGGVSFVQFSYSNDRAVLHRWGISVAGTLAIESVRSGPSPSPQQLDRLQAAWLKRKADLNAERLNRYAEERKQENAEDLRRLNKERREAREQ